MNINTSLQEILDLRVHSIVYTLSILKGIVKRKKKEYHMKQLVVLITGTSSDPRVLRLLPPLCLKEFDVDVFVEALTQALRRE